MSRSLKKGPYVKHKILSKIEAMNPRGEKKVLRTWSRDSVIFPQMVGHTIAVHAGRRHVPIYITENMVGHRSGELAPSAGMSPRDHLLRRREPGKPWPPTFVLICIFRVFLRRRRAWS